MTELEGFGETSAQTWSTRSRPRKEEPFFRVLYGLGMAGIG